MPKTVKFTLAIVLIKIVVYCLLIAVAQVTVYFKADHGFWLGFQEKLARTAGAQSLTSYDPYYAGVFSGMISFHLIFYGLVLWTLLKRWFVASILLTALLLLAVLGNQSFPLAPIVLLILMCTQSGRFWLKRKVLIPALSQGAEPLLSPVESRAKEIPGGRK